MTDTRQAVEGAPGFCRVALPRPLRQTFVYRVPPRFRGAVEPGHRVLVPFRRREIVGCVDELVEETDVEGVRPVRDVLDRDPVLSRPMLRLSRWVARYYVAPLGLVLRAALPPGLFAESTYRVSPAEADAEVEDAEGDVERAVLERLARASGPLQVGTLRQAAGDRSVWPALRALADRGMVRIEEEPPEAEGPVRTRQVIRLVEELPTLVAREERFGRAERQREAYETLEDIGGEASVAHMERQLGFSRSVLEGLAEKGVAEIREEEERRDPFADRDVEPPPRLEPTEAQSTVIEALVDRVGRDDPGICLLRGVTGSGKTFVYLEVMREVVERSGRGAIVLVPEISLTPQTVQRFRAVFGDEVAVLHSSLSAGERYDEWRSLREGRKRVAVGARSAIFAPVGDLGLVVVDEEHEGSYKQSDVPRYHARSVAAVRARLEGALCVLGSATPSLESWHNAADGRYELFELPERVTGHPLPDVEIVDLRAELEARRDRAVGRSGDGSDVRGGPPGDDGAAGGHDSEPPPPAEESGPLVLGTELREALAATLEAEEQAILLLNRRGYSSYVQCRECGHVWSCGSCSVSLTHHRSRNRLVCHHCGWQEAVPRNCEECGARGLSFSGLGTEQVERRVGELFPDARVARMDVDTTGSKWAHFEILDRVARREVDVLLGTQMIAKGLDFPSVTLVGVVNADVGLNLPDFRASERTFQLLAQVAGRAGRGERPGRVVVQTYRPEHFALQRAAEHDFPGFAGRELEDRSGPGYPPHRRLANLVVSGPGEEEVADTALELAAWTRELLDRHEVETIDVVGPAPCAIQQVRERWRWHFLLKADEAGPLGVLLRALDDRHGQPGGELRLEIDRDPDSLL